MAILYSHQVSVICCINYITRLASNEIFSLSTKLIIAIILAIPFLIWLIKSLYTNIQNQETINFYIINNLTNIPLIKLYNFPTITSLCKNLFNLLEFLAEAFRCQVHYFQCLENYAHGIEKLLQNSSKLNKFLHSEVNLLIQHIIVQDQDGQNNNIL